MSILIVGAGGIGCELVKSLLFYGYMEFSILDFDLVEECNLLNQTLYCKEHVGNFKVNAIQSVTMSLAQVFVTPVVGRLQEQPDHFYSQFKYVFGCLDNIKSRRDLNFILSRLVNPPIYIDCGSGGERGQVKYIEYGKTSCLECVLQLYLPDSDSHIVPYCSLKAIPQNRFDAVLKAVHVDFTVEVGIPFNFKISSHIDWALKKCNEYISCFRLGDHYNEIDFLSVFGSSVNASVEVNSTISKVAVSFIHDIFVYGNFDKFDFISIYKDLNQNLDCGRLYLEKDSDCPVCS